MGNPLARALLFAFYASFAFGADVVKTTYVPDAERGNPDPKSKTEIIQIVFGPGEEKLVQRLLSSSIQEAFESNPKATIDVLCAIGGTLSREECAALKAELASHEKHRSYSFEGVEGELTAPDADEKKARGTPATAPRGISPGMSRRPLGQPIAPADDATDRSPAALRPDPARQPSDWKGVLTLIRTVSSGVTVGVTASLSKGANWGQALIVGGTAGAWSGFMQWKLRERLNWQAHEGWLKFTPPAPHEQAGLVKRYLKRAIQTGVYAALLSTGFYAAGLNHDLLSVEQVQRLLLTVGESLYTQTAWEALNQEWTEAAIRRNGKRAWLYRRLSGLGALAQATINVTANALNVGGVHLADVHLGTAISGTVGTAGTLTYLWRWAPHVARRQTDSLANAVLSACRVVLKTFGGAGAR